MKKFLIAAAAIGALVAGAANAEGKISYNAGVATDYVFRGVTQNDSKPALQVGVDYTNSIFYAGAWGSNVSFASREIDLYAGVRPTVGKAAFDLGLVYYNYDDDDISTTEGKIAVSYPFGKLTGGAAYYVNTDDTDTYYYEVNGAYPLSDKLSASAALGEQKFAGGGAYSTGNVGVTYTFNPTWSADLRYSDTNVSEKISKDYAARVSLLVKAAF